MSSKKWKKGICGICPAGCWVEVLIEDGKLTKIVNNLRFTEKISHIINNITDIENQAYTVPYSSNYGEFGIESVRMPHVKVSGFKISSSTKKV